MRDSRDGWNGPLIESLKRWLWKRIFRTLLLLMRRDMLQTVSTTQLQVERRRGEVERARSVEGQAIEVAYFIELSGSGETTVEVNFPMSFSEKPITASGGELAPNTPLVVGNYPWCSVMVASWKKDTSKGHDYYTGAKLVLVVGGPSNQKSIIHFTAKGKALVSPNK